MRLVQLMHKDVVRVAQVVDADTLELIETRGGMYALAQAAIAQKIGLRTLVERSEKGERISYQEVIDQRRLLPPLTHPDPAHLVVSGTGLTHLGSASSRAAMHAKLSGENELTDSMKMFKHGVEGGKPADDSTTGFQPEWFYKGDGSSVVAPEQPLPIPAFAQDAGEEPELVGLYVIGDGGLPYRLGFAVGNEFSDHVTERFNYLWLAHSKLRACSYGPELLVGDLPADLQGTSRIVRNKEIIWEKPFLTGEANMCHSIANLEHHHFKYQQFCRSGDVHVHYFGTATLSFADEVRTQDGDCFEISLPALGRPLRNTIKRTGNQEIKRVKAL